MSEMTLKQVRDRVAQSTACREGGKIPCRSCLLTAFGAIARYLDPVSGEAQSPRMLPIVQIGGKRYYVDERLKQLRNVESPHDYADW